MTPETSHEPVVDVTTKLADRLHAHVNRPRIREAQIGNAIVAAVAVTAVVMALAGPVAAKAKGIHFTVKLTGASISATETVFKAHDSYFGSGAGVSSMKVNAAGNGGTDSETTYYGDATARSKGSFKVGQPNSQGVASLTGTGHDVSGTGRARHLSSTYTYRGTINLKTGIYTFTLTGTYYL